MNGVFGLLALGIIFFAGVLLLEGIKEGEKEGIVKTDNVGENDDEGEDDDV